MFYRKNLHVRIVDKGIEEVGCLSKQCVGLPWDWGHLKRYMIINSNKKMSSKEETYRRIHANTKPESWVFFRLWWSRHLFQTQLIGIKKFPRKLFLEIYICVQFAGY